MQNKIIIDIKNLTYIFNEKTTFEKKAIDNLSYSFEEGKIHYIIGNSGSGKTTLVQHLNGLLKSKMGDIKVGNFRIEGKRKKIADIKILRKFISIVFQYPEYQIFKDTVRNEIMFGPITYGLHKKAFQEKNFSKLVNEINKNPNIIDHFLKKNDIKFNDFIENFNLNNVKFKRKNAKIKYKYKNKMCISKIYFEIISLERIIEEMALYYLKKLGLPESLLYNSPFGLSGGQKRRIAIAGILAIEPKILIFDEPTAGLDPQGVKEMLSIIKEEKKNGKTLIIITHSMDEVLECADNVIFIDNGKIILSGSPYNIFRNSKIYENTKIQKPKVIDFIDKLIKMNDKYSYLYKCEPRTSEELANYILEII
ncbi:MAG: ATP-binding cassette domain-containing protein [Mycoplasmoidaceae bacterium]